jgi:cobalt-zinc-cadmium efflux system membrane fusion protein
MARRIIGAGKRITVGLGLLSLTASLGCGTPEVVSGTGEDPGGGGVVTLWTDEVELFYEHPPLVAGAEGESWAIHLTFMDSFLPVTEGRLTLRFTASDGSEFTVGEEAPARPGVYNHAPSLETPGEYQVAMVLESASLRTEIECPPLRVYPSVDALPLPDPASGGGTISFLKEQAWVIPFATAQAELGRVPNSFQGSGILESPPGRLAEVAAPVSGLVQVADNRGAPSPGDRVRAGQLLATLAPVEGDASFAAQRARLVASELEFERATRLHEAGAVPRKRLEEAERELEVARVTLEALGEGQEGGFGFEVRAPFSGVISARQMELGGRVSAGDPLFTVLDPTVIWLKVRAPARFGLGLNEIRGASFTVEGSTQVFRAERVVSVGSIVDPATRSIPVTFQVSNPDGHLKIGMFADARLLLDESVEGVVVPSSAVLNEDGLSVVYVQTEGESFARRILTLGPSDGDWTLVEAGLEAGERVVVIGAYQVRLASLNTSEIGEGHVH